MRGGKMYANVCAGGSCGIVGLPVAGGAPMKIATVTQEVLLAASNQTAIYGYDASFEIVKYPLDGSAAEPIAARKKPTAGGGQLNMAADDDAIYWAEVGAGMIELKWRKK